MFVLVREGAKWSKWAIGLGIWSFVTAVIFGLGEGVVRATFGSYPHLATFLTMAEIWTYAFRNIAETLLTVAAIVFVGAKFLEARTVFSVGFDKLDPKTIAFKGPDENNTIWIGQRYPSKFEAETIAAVIEERLKESAA